VSVRRGWYSCAWQAQNSSWIKCAFETHTGDCLGFCHFTFQSHQKKDGMLNGTHSLANHTEADPKRSLESPVWRLFPSPIYIYGFQPYTYFFCSFIQKW